MIDEYLALLRTHRNTIHRDLKLLAAQLGFRKRHTAIQTLSISAFSPGRVNVPPQPSQDMT
ncbi:hypothetical protein ACVMIH_001675 [Bradyrhizobium sp. USDA 4503]